MSFFLKNVFQIVLEGFFPKPGADYSSTSSSNPDKTFIFVNSRPVHHKDMMKVKSLLNTTQFIQLKLFFFFASNNFLLAGCFFFVHDLQLLRQHYAAQYPDDAARNRYPTAMLKVTVSPSSVDVNLTPDKTQVFLHDKVAVKFKLHILPDVIVFFFYTLYDLSII